MLKSKINKKIIITGTHPTPAIELIKQLREDGENSWEIIYIGRKFNSSVSHERSIESVLIPEMGVKFWEINCGKFDRRYWPNTIIGIPDTIKGLLAAWQIVGQEKPNIVVSFGGYVSVPVVAAAWLMGIPVISHEQTLTISLATKINSYFSKKVALSFEKTIGLTMNKQKNVVTGNLIRREIFAAKSEKMAKILAGKKQIVLVTAGNQGSTKINDLIISVKKKINNNWTIVHQTGKLDLVRIREQTKNWDNYFCFDYLTANDFGYVLNRSELVIARGGANTCQDIEATAKKAIIIPLPVSQQDEQKLNARWLKRKLGNLVEIIDDKNVSPDVLLKRINKLAAVVKKENQVNGKINYKLRDLINEVV